VALRDPGRDLLNPETWSYPPSLHLLPHFAADFESVPFAPVVAAVIRFSPISELLVSKRHRVSFCRGMMAAG